MPVASSGTPGLTSPSWWQMNDLTMQTVAPAQSFLVLTNQALYTLTRKRPFDHFVQILTESQGQDSDLLRRFADNYTDEQLAAMALALACDNAYAFSISSHGLPGMNQQVRLWASRCFLELAPRHMMGNSIEQSKFHMGAGDVQQSHTVGFNASVLYLARLVSPLWFVKLSSMDNVPVFVETFTTMIDGLTKLKTFLSTAYMQTLFAAQHASEKEAVEMLLSLIELCIQGAQFVLVLMSSNFSSFFLRYLVVIVYFCIF